MFEKMKSKWETVVEKCEAYNEEFAVDQAVVKAEKETFKLQKKVAKAAGRQLKAEEKAERQRLFDEAVAKVVEAVRES